ncbi:flagellar basal body rod protein FlgB [Rheinheimera sp. YQF-2]|jgi:flagellar basal-body rod protein FlgB|uniref:Flagellar basal body rod protein FlgB n=1 Tax=Rheinheimera lutimaris TaxID=2740584 RepID=A0A7Y5AQQ6_9GAMM|nr:MULTISPECIES: flagellar basal body rod protein FlgB [Rheinheimera]MDP2715561.1 flagellar basal body rod protein FlgB [Rheinheimera sp.]NRQ42339.1 flagellar basal body rod protein FlgB [Rheinheimera lutimaris]
MAISFEKAFGMHPEAMLVRDRRAQVLAENIANADTPGYKAKDVDFQQALNNAKARQSGAMARTHEKHFHISTAARHETQFRNPDQPDTGDGNSVDIHRERNAVMQNSLEYQTSMSFLNSRISGLKKAITGGGQ